MKTKTSETETEDCVLCGKDTGIPRGCEIQDLKRKGLYVEGAGQLCEPCFDEVYS